MTYKIKDRIRSRCRFTSRSELVLNRSREWGGVSYCSCPGQPPPGIGVKSAMKPIVPPDLLVDGASLGDPYNLRQKVLMRIRPAHLPSVLKCDITEIDQM
ncbi:hypothetical protein EVAR_99220_1 [Eumeta japonica]|uniref:Uncharacterized protein n=1 Tax=Eumeta variegata TaxID=151549 RepID=A0A4C1YKM0_EUMVA|nr:hypothetical protein EVAR_99220_1 [Eumeta japonica]